MIPKINKPFQSDVKQLRLVIADNTPNHTKFLCQDYWQLEENFKLTNHIDLLKERYKIDAHFLHNIAHKYSHLEAICETCEKPFLTFTKRTEFTYEWLRQFNQGFPVMCQPCNEAMPAEGE